jgi:chemotaxis protein CheX
MKSMNESYTGNPRHEDWLPLLELAVQEVSSLMLACKLTTPATVVESSLNVTAMVGLAGLLCGVMSVRCADKTAALITSKMLGVSLDKVGPDVADAIGEVCNMVAGNFKNKIAGLSEGCLLAPPTVITGSDYNLQAISGSPSLEVSLLFEGLPFVVCLQIQSS